jgi:hypothetical protein
MVALLSKLSLFSLKHMLGPGEFSMSFKKNKNYVAWGSINVPQREGT